MEPLLDGLVLDAEFLNAACVLSGAGLGDLVADCLDLLLQALDQAQKPIGFARVLLGGLTLATILAAGSR